MARRRMFSLDIVDSDQFTELPITTRLLYFELGSRGDDDGFIANPKKIAKFADCSEEDIKTLVDKGFAYVFDSGPLVIRHWLANNQLRNDRYHETYFKNEKSMIGVNLKNKTYYYGEECETIAVMESAYYTVYKRNPIDNNGKITLTASGEIGNWAYLQVIAQIQQDTILEYVAYKGIKNIRPPEKNNDNENTGGINTSVFIVVSVILLALIGGLVVVIFIFQQRNKSLLK